MGDPQEANEDSLVFSESWNFFSSPIAVTEFFPPPISSHFSKQNTHIPTHTMANVNQTQQEDKVADDFTMTASDFEDNEDIEGGDRADDLTIRAKWSLDGCNSISEIVARLESQKQYYLKLQQEGWEVVSEVSDDWGSMRQTKTKTKTKTAKIKDVAVVEEANANEPL